MTTFDLKFQEWTARDIDNAKSETLDHYEQLLHSKPEGLNEKDILEQLKDEELFTLITLRTYIYFKDFFQGMVTVDGLPTKKACVKRALDNAKSHFKKTREEVIECFTTDWDSYNII